MLIRGGLALLIALIGTACAGGTDALPLAPPPAPPSGGAATLAIGARAAALPVGFQTQLFVSGTNGGGVAQSNRSVAWTTSDPAVVAVDANGVISAVGPGGARIGVTASDGSTAATTITSAIASVATTARVGFNTALGLPTDADSTDDVLIARRQYTLSLNPRRGVANWAAWHLDAIDFLPTPRSRDSACSAPRPTTGSTGASIHAAISPRRPTGRVPTATTRRRSFSPTCCRSDRT